MSDSTQTYDIVIAGTGAAGLLLAYRLSKENIYSSSRILLIDKEIKTGDDRTWCFWEQGKGEWDHILYTSWESVRFCADGFSQTDKIAFTLVNKEMQWSSKRPKVIFPVKLVLPVSFRKSR
ncbi:MAG: NAD(P)-binding protein [Saprospiraceae bacterium]|nr:NAD(P)-binding protein [Saprospiraceae bacterium]